MKIETIKRANRLWSNDLAFVKDHLIVPMSREKLMEMKLDFPNTVNPNDVNFDLNENNNVRQSNKTEIAQNSNSDEQNNDQFKDYLNKFDSFLNESKIKLKTLETNSK